MVRKIKKPKDDGVFVEKIAQTVLFIASFTQALSGFKEKSFAEFFVEKFEEFLDQQREMNAFLKGALGQPLTKEDLG